MPTRRPANGTSRAPFNPFTATTLSGGGDGVRDGADDYIFVHGDGTDDRAERRDRRSRPASSSISESRAADQPVT